MAKAAAEVAPSVKMMTPADAGVLKDAITASGASKVTGLYNVPIDMIKVAPAYNLRFRSSDTHKTQVSKIRYSILTNGFYQDQPLTGYVGKVGDASAIFVINGHTRLEAAKLAMAEGAEITTLPMMLVPADSSARDIAARLETTNSGEKLSMLGLAILVKRFITDGMTDDEIMTKLGISVQHLKNLKMILAATKPVRQLVASERISPTMAVAIIKKCSKGQSDPDGKIAEQTIVAMVAKAEARGESKATQVDTEEGTVKSGKRTEVVEKEGEDGEKETAVRTSKPATIITKWPAQAGDVLNSRDKNFVFFRKLGGDSTWYEESGDGQVTITENVMFELKVTRPKKEEPVKEKAPAAPAKKVTKGAAKAAAPAKAAAAEGSGFVEETSAGVDPDLESSAVEL